jgi:hypothetical protein
LEKQLEQVGLMMDDRETRSGAKFQKARAELDRLEHDFRDTDILCNIMIINMAHVEIDRYKVERQVKYCRVMREFAEYKVVANNDVRRYDLKVYRCMGCTDLYITSMNLINEDDQIYNYN